ncbi:photosystem II reaction center phosphoprotein PsbH [Anthocerotibacter panamensis]|uniref:photosystem II reaction center phosphoprotein PsbH n=1 Tax=Anthocerotibacter panamensis TaxID=2857077 RepID=UPI001C405F4C|nr:photosystem II reaction center protein PsbH [Anthocerotibacter panamensis]
MAIRTWLGDRLKPLNSEYGKASPGWGTTPVMGALIVLFGLFLIIIIQLFNGSLVIDGFKTTPW